jgi:hypothetical protein
MMDLSLKYSCVVAAIRSQSAGKLFHVEGLAAKTFVIEMGRDLASFWRKRNRELATSGAAYRPAHEPACVGEAPHTRLSSREARCGKQYRFERPIAGG